MNPKYYKWLSAQPNASGVTRTVSGELPLAVPLVSQNQNAKNWTLKGDVLQNGTPTPTSIIDPQFVGTADENGNYSTKLTIDGGAVDDNLINTFTDIDTATLPSTIDGNTVKENSRMLLSEIKGKSATSQNLLPYPYLFTTLSQYDFENGIPLGSTGLYNANGKINYKDMGDGSIQMNTVAEAPQNWSTAIIVDNLLLQAGNYYLKIQGVFYTVYNSNGGVIDYFGNAGTFHLSEPTSIKIAIRQITLDTVYTDYILYPILNVGTSALPYVPYYSGTKSPTFQGVRINNNIDLTLFETPQELLENDTLTITKNANNNYYTIAKNGITIDSNLALEEVSSIVSPNDTISIIGNNNEAYVKPDLTAIFNYNQKYTTLTIPLGTAPLRAINENYDTISKNGERTNTIGYLELTGNEQITAGSSPNLIFIYGYYCMANDNAISIICDRCQAVTGTQLLADINTSGINQCATLYGIISFHMDGIDTASEFITYAQAQYANGTPIKVAYVKVYADTTQVTSTNLPLYQGNNTIDSNETLKPSNLLITYHKEV